MSKKRKILIAEDEKPMAMALDLKLQAEGFETKVAYNGQQVMDLLAKEKFDLLLLDLIMPIKDGFSVLEDIKKKKIKIHIIVSTNLGQPEDKKRVEKLGAEYYFIKAETPINHVVKFVKNILD